MMTYATQKELCLAESLGYEYDCNTHRGHQFTNKYRQVWSIRDGWQTADLVEGFFMNHAKYDNLTDALNRSMNPINDGVIPVLGLRRHPSEYVLITNAELIRSGCGMRRYLRLAPHYLRLAPHLGIPEGYVRVDSIDGMSVYQDNGKLQPKWMSLQRYSND